MWIKATVVADPLHHERHMRDYWLAAGLVLAFACNVGLIGLFLLWSDPAGRTGEEPMGPSRRVFVLPVYLATSGNIALIASCIEITRSQLTGLAWYFLCPPSIIMQLCTVPMRSIGSSPIAGYVGTALFYLFYYLSFFYPLYRRRYGTMLVLGGIHVGLGLVLLGVVAALHAH